jgi:hypothetical protein
MPEAECRAELVVAREYLQTMRTFLDQRGWLAP